MEQNMHIEEQLVADLQTAFANAEVKVQREEQVTLSIGKDEVSAVLLKAKNQLGYNYFTHLSCVDWIEDNQFELVYILWSPKDKVNLFVRTRLDRENPETENTDMIWRQINTYQREIREMYGVEFPGFVGDKEFILEDWDEEPPMKRNFDTLEFVNDTFFEREGREDAKDVREQIAEKSGEEIPDFAKKYSRQ
jgi:NADH-quinone oxidoreductase subunit C